MNIYTLVRKAARDSILTTLPEFFPTSVEQNAGVIFSHTNGAEPSIPYVVINILSIEQQGHHSTSPLSNIDEEIVSSAFYEVMVQYSFCGSSAGDMAQSFSHRVSNNPLVSMEQQRNKLAFMRKSTVRRAPQKRDTTWVENFNIDITYNYVLNEVVTVDIVEGVVLTTDIDGIEELVKIPETIIYP